MTKRKQYSLTELVAQSDPDAPVPKELRDWEQSASVGLEQLAMVSQVELQEAALKFAELLSKEFDVVQLVLYGSRARGDYSAESDTTVAVLLRGENEGLEQFVNMKLALASVAYDTHLLTDVLIRPYPVWEVEWRDPEGSLAVDPELLKNIARHGITLWQASGSRPTKY